MESAEQHENVVIEIPSVSYNHTDSLQTPFGSESLKRACDANCIDEKIQAAKEDPRKILGVQNNSKENIQSFSEAANFSNNISSATANGDINKALKPLKVNYDQIPVLHYLNVSNHVIPASTATNVKHAINSQRITENQQHVTNGIENGQQGISTQWAHNPEKSLTDLIPGLSDNVSHEYAVQLPLMQNPTTAAGHRREVSLMDEDFFIYTKQEVGNSNHEAYYNKMQKEMEVPFIKDMKDNQLELPDLLGNITDVASNSPLLDAISTEAQSSNATEAESTFSDSNVENAATDKGGKDDPFSNALIAEMEADMYGLQIIKNAELEELRELGFGTYGTVYHGRWRGSDVAIKRIKKSCFAGRSSEEEHLVGHPSIITILPLEFPFYVTPINKN